MADEPSLFDMYEANAARTRRRAPVREPDPLSLYASQGGVSWDKFLPSEQRAMQSAASLQAGGDYNPRDVLLGAIGAVGAPAMGPAQGGATLGSGVIKPIRAYHGSPHDFDRFDLSKIGTGEGAQAYGHGLYFAENPKVAADYRRRLSPNEPVNVAPDAEAAAKFAPEWEKLVEQRRALAGSSGRGDTTPIDTLMNEVHEKMVADTIARNPNLAGRMYEVNINAAPEQFLDWDKPLSQMSPEVQKAVQPRLQQIPEQYRSTDPQGEFIWRAMHPQGGLDPVMDFSRTIPAQAMERLREAGIPGIKYLDQGSRGVPTSNGRVQALGGKFHIVDDFGTQAGPFDTLAEAQQYLKPMQQTSNYVLFRDDIIDIVKKYGWAGLAAFGIDQDMAKAALNEQTNIGRQKYDDVKG